MTAVVDASVIVAALVDAGPIGRWAERQLQTERLAAPHLLPVEASNVLRRAELVGDLSSEIAALAHADLMDLPIELYPFEPFADRVWQLRKTITAYDAWYVALAERSDTTLATLDGRLATAPGPMCSFAVPPS
jgi:predicted nucleic acid-binding protein